VRPSAKDLSRTHYLWDIPAKKHPEFGKASFEKTKLKFESVDSQVLLARLLLRFFA